MTIYDKIKQLAERRGMAIYEVEDAVGLGRSTITKWRTASPKLESVKQVADYFHVPVDYLADGDLQNSRILAYYTKLYEQYASERDTENSKFMDKFDQLGPHDREIIMELIEIMLKGEPT